MILFPPSLRRYDILLLLLGLATAVCAKSAWFAAALATTHILFPFATLMAAAPAVFFLLILFRLMLLFFPSTGWLTALGAVALLVVAVPLLANLRLELAARALTAGDLDGMDGPFKGRTLGIVANPGSWSQQETKCDDVCMHALLSGALDRVIVAFSWEGDLPIDPDERAVAFHMERRATCPRIKVRSGVNPIHYDPAAYRPYPPPEPAGRMRAEAAKGNCLIETKARLGDAEAVARLNTIKAGYGPYTAGLNPFADTLAASRGSFWVRKGAAFEERYRQTSVQTAELLPVLLPSYVVDREPDRGIGFLRSPGPGDSGGGHADPDRRRAFFIETLGLDLGEGA